MSGHAGVGSRLSVAGEAIEPQFYAALLRGLGVDAASSPEQMDRAHWSQTAQRFAEIFVSRTRDEWCTVFDGTDACVAPVLGLGEVANHPHNRARDLLIRGPHGDQEPAPAPRLSRTPGTIGRPMPQSGQHTHEVLTDYGFTQPEIRDLTRAGVIEAS